MNALRPVLTITLLLALLSATGAGAATLTVHQELDDLVFNWDGGLDTLERATSPEGPFVPVAADASSPLRLVNEALLVGEDYYYRLVAGSNMAFRLEWRFPALKNRSNLHLVSLPLLPGLQDISDPALPDDPCDFTSGGGGPQQLLDGVVNADDAICRFWTDREESDGGAMFVVQNLDPDSCLYTGRLGMRISPSQELRIGGFTESIQTPEALQVGYFVNTQVGNADEEMENRTILVGSHDPAFAGHLVAAGGCDRDVLNLPYHTMYRRADEILCGLDSVDWRDDDANGAPDTCPAGIYDPVSGVAVTVMTVDTDPESPGYGRFLGRTVFSVNGRLHFVGSNFALRAGEAYMVAVTEGYQPRVFLSPHW